MSEKNYSKDMFQLVQENERLLDKPLKTKQLSYFQDAMIRFTKNKYNVIATVILAIFILMSIFVPIITPKNLYTQTNSSLTTLPPRIPLLEKIGIFNGTKKYKNQPIDYDTVDPDTGLGYPTVGFQVDYILMDTLENQQVVGSDRSAQYRGGTNELYVNFDRTAYSIVSKEPFTFQDGYQLQVDINEMKTAGTVSLYLSTVTSGATLEDWDDLVFIGSATEAGIYTYDAMASIANGSSYHVLLKYEIDEPSANGQEYVSLNAIHVLDDEDESVQTYSGFELSDFALFVIDTTTENGRYLRKNAVMTVASFTYDVYSALFSDRQRTIGEVEYLRILSENEGMEETIVLDEENPTTTWSFGENFPLTGVVNVHERTIGGKVYRTYDVMMNGAYQLGFEDTPYFLFGTNVFGQDLFTLIWLGLRTSLLLGFLAALVNIIIGIIWGATSAYYGGQVDILMERFTDIWGSFPQITMIGIITVLIGPGFTALFIFMVYDGWIGAAKITRSQFYRYKGREYVLAARTLGASDRRIIFKHILPNALGTIVTRVILSIPSVIFLEVNLSYLGFGIGNGQELKIGPISLTGTSIGVLLNDGQQQIFAGNLWLVIAPTIIVSVLMITFNMFGNALRDALNPQLRGN
ncbi:MAG: ABC transporter permease [Acholeplasmataceae bacterium]|jgi:ABC-type dipeptide/oligopeptide/nickel transport system permease subunit|nr:ABC transporter permease [Acholeplasmataceae bacterium]